MPHPFSDTPQGDPRDEFLFGAPAEAELQVKCHFTELMLQSREIEDQTRVARDGRPLLLWEALKEVTEDCLACWARAERGDRDALVREALATKERCAREGQDLVFAALGNPLHAKAVARVLLLGHNFLRTLDICLEALLRYPSQKSATPKPTRTEVEIDWAIGGVRDWVCHFPYAFEKAGRGARAPQRMAHITRHYTTDRTVRSQISHKQIANIFMLRETTVADLERRGLAKLRDAFMQGGPANPDLSELTER
jgi:hypothetical protein